MKPDKVVILGHTSEIQYKENSVEVDVFRRDSCFGQYDPWTRIIRIYDNGRKESEILETLIHEILHAIALDLKLKCFDGEDGHEDLDKLALVLADTFARNNWLKN